ncbi:hypothetical protein J2Z17_000113 [Rhizobium halophytocola]|uniref:Uncharacterized protein n=1 Tax=Rhizobium halophytocola TaxID=735519 RepID=A0ABS4DSM8_9HYPH|nr:hypothetical protein [Rhizobium halophytocola]
MRMHVLTLELPPSGLPAISPSRGEISWALPIGSVLSNVSTVFWSLDVDVEGRRLPISPLEGEMPGSAEGGSPVHTRRTDTC